MPTYTPLQTIEITDNTTTSITFSGIPQIYKDLVIVNRTGVSNTCNFWMRFNGDSGTNYSSTMLWGNGSSASSSRRANDSLGILLDVVGSPANSLTAIHTIHLNDYSNTTTNKTALVRASVPANEAATIAGLWRNKNAITSITIYPDNSRTLNAGSTFDLYGISPVQAGVAKAFGGNSVVYDSTYVYHTFTTSGTFTPYQTVSCDVLVVAGGGGGGNWASGGGGAGGVSYISGLSVSTSQSVTIGAGGAQNNSGSNSVFSGITSNGGGRGGTNSTPNNGTAGGSGGGGAIGGTGGSANQGNTGGATGYGNNGGNALGVTGEPYPSAGGGGAGGAGQSISSPSGNPGAGGIGITNSTINTLNAFGAATGTGQLSGGNYYYAGGGGGASSGGGAAGGLGGGGAGSNSMSVAGVAGTANTGGGGGGQRQSGTGGSGGSGIVIVRYAR
jgi:hypothetical protein